MGGENVFGDARAMTSIALSMIVKNEAHVIERCLTSVLPVIDLWCIVDTGSTDGTQLVIKRFFGQHRRARIALPKRVWRDFRNTTEAKRSRLRGKWPPRRLPSRHRRRRYPHRSARLAQAEPRGKDAYFLQIDDENLVYKRLQVFKTNRGFHYEGVLHEVLMPVDGRTVGTIEGLVYKRTGGGSRSADPKKYHRDAEILQAALSNDPTNARYAFYLRKAGAMRRKTRNAGPRTNTAPRWADGRKRSTLRCTRPRERANDSSNRKSGS